MSRVRQPSPYRLRGRSAPGRKGKLDHARAGQSRPDLLGGRGFSGKKSDECFWIVHAVLKVRFRVAPQHCLKPHESILV